MDRAASGESIGFEWKLQCQKEPRNAVSTQAFDERFDRMLLEVVAFKERECHCRIPQHYEKDPKLGVWAKNRRSEKERDYRKKRKKKS
jgi:hypothetical protein